MEKAIIIVVVSLVGAGLIAFEPRLSMTSEKNLLLWYNSQYSRKYIRIW